MSQPGQQNMANQGAQISVDEIAREQMYTNVISQRDGLIIMLANQVDTLKKELQELKSQKSINGDKEL